MQALSSSCHGSLLIASALLTTIHCDCHVLHESCVRHARYEAVMMKVDLMFSMLCVSLSVSVSVGVGIMSSLGCWLVLWCCPMHLFCVSPC